MSSVYEPEDWMDAGEYLRRIANGRDPNLIATELRVALVRQCMRSPVFMMRNFFKTINKDGRLVRYEPWAGQAMLDMCIQAQLKAGVAQSVVEVKPRQIGWTQHAISRAVQRMMFPNMRILACVNDEDVAKTIIHRAATIYNNLEPWMRPMKRIENEKTLILDNPNVKARHENPGLNSQFTCTVPSGIRGTTPNIFIWSEAAYCEEWQQVVDGVLNSMGASPSFCRIIDTTPNGSDPFYKPLVYEAMERNPKWVAMWSRKEVPTRQEIIDGKLGVPDRPKEGWVPVFFPMQWHPEYTTQDESPEGQLPHVEPDELQRVQETLGKVPHYGGEEEKELMGRFGLSIYRIIWRRWKIVNDTAGVDLNERLNTFRQEHATDVHSMFIKHGSGAWDAEGIRHIESQQVRPPFAQGCLRREENHRITIDQEFHSSWMSIKFWATPHPNDQYVIGVDSSNAWFSPGADATCAQVLRRRDLKQVAVMHARCPPDTWREQLALLYYYYNHAYLGIEMEGVAIDVAYKLYLSGVTNQYWYKRPDMDPLREPTAGLGWETNVKTRSGMQIRLLEAISHKDQDQKSDPLLFLCDYETYDELIECTRDPNGKIGNWSGGHDDRVMALMIALAIHDDAWAPAKRKDKPEELPNAWLQKSGIQPVSDHKRWLRNHPEYGML